MDESTRVKFQKRYESICRDRGWIDEDGHYQFPADPEQRMEAIRDMFGLATISNTDSTYQSYREQLDARELEASSHSDAMQLLSKSSDEIKSAVLSVIDEVLDSSVYSFLIQLDRFDHGHLSIHHQECDQDSAVPIAETDMDITTDSFNEMFQDALRWREEFGMNTEIGRPDPTDL